MTLELELSPSVRFPGEQPGTNSPWKKYYNSAPSVVVVGMEEGMSELDVTAWMDAMHGPRHLCVSDNMLE